MSSEILVGNAQPAGRMRWRTVAAQHTLSDREGVNAELEIVRRIEQARQEGFAQGLAAGRHETEQQFLPAIQNLARTLDELARLRQTMREESAQDLVRLATSIAARVIHREVSIDPDALAGLVQAAFIKLQSREISRARVHPSLENLLRRCLEQPGAPKHLVLSVDSALAPGEVIFETSQGVLDASVETQLREIERGLIDKLDGRD